MFKRLMVGVDWNDSVICVSGICELYVCDTKGYYII